MSDNKLKNEFFESLDLFAYEEFDERDFFGNMEMPRNLNHKIRITSDTHDFFTGIFPEEVVDLINTSDKKFTVTVSRIELRDGDKNVLYRQRLQELIDANNSTEDVDIDDDDLYELTPMCEVSVQFAWEKDGEVKKVFEPVRDTGNWIGALSRAFEKYKKEFNLQKDFMDILRNDGSVVQ